MDNYSPTTRYFRFFFNKYIFFLFTVIYLKLIIFSLTHSCFNSVRKINGIVIKWLFYPKHKIIFLPFFWIFLAWSWLSKLLHNKLASTSPRSCKQSAQVPPQTFLLQPKFSAAVICFWVSIAWMTSIKWQF